MKRAAVLFLTLVLCLSTLCPTVAGPSYDPLLAPRGFQAAALELGVQDVARGRTIPLRVYLPSSRQPAPVVLFSHGLGGSRHGSAYLGQHWAARGYAAVFLQHAGSDDSVWRDVPRENRMAAMRRAASGKNLLLRLGDVKATLDQLEAWNRTSSSPLARRLDLARVGMSGHSFGAVTTQWVSGETTSRARGAGLQDSRTRAAVIMSPSSPRNEDAKTAFGRVRIPWMLMTGTHDLAPIGNADMTSRLGVYPALPPGHKYELVLFDAEHSAFTDRALPGEVKPRNPNHHRAILALTTAFWDAFLRDDPAALAWLEGDGPRGILQPKDRWQHK